MAKQRVRRINTGEYNPSAQAKPTSMALMMIPNTPPRVSPERIRLVITALTIGGFAAIGADCWMSWAGFSSLPIDWWVAATFTAIVAISQLGSGVIQALGGDPFAGIGGSASGDGAWGITLRGLYGLDIFSNFSGFGGTMHLSFQLLWADPLGTLGLVLWNLVLAVLLAFGDEILFRLRDRIAIGAQKNQQLAKIRAINVRAHNVALDQYRNRAMEQARQVGQNLNVRFDWLKGRNDA
ncbi:MAG: hypothetical protein AAF528_00135 [Cyanobacteria bacterium P01_C01_bin.121]